METKQRKMGKTTFFFFFSRKKVVWKPTMRKQIYLGEQGEQDLGIGWSQWHHWLWFWSMDTSDQDFTDKNLTGACQKSLPQQRSWAGCKPGQEGWWHKTLKIRPWVTAQPCKRHVVGKRANKQELAKGHVCVFCGQPLQPYHDNCDILGYIWWVFSPTAISESKVLDENYRI